jgi:hypothetical protein
MGTGIDGQIGLAEEVTWGTRVAPARFLEYNEESIQLNNERIESQGLRAGRRVTRHWVNNRKGAGGGITFEVMNKGFGLLFKHMLGATAVTTPGGGTLSRDHTATVGDLDSKSLTVQKGVPPILAATQPFDYTGGKISEWEITNDVDGLLMLSCTFDFQTEDTAQTLASASYASGIEPLTFLGGLVTIGGAATDLSNFSLSGSNGLKTDRYYIRQSGLKKEQIEDTERRNYEGSFSADFENLTLYNRFANGTEAAIVAKWEGSIIEAALKYEVEVTLPRCRFEGETPTVGGPDVVAQPVAFKALDPTDGVTSPVTIRYRTTDTAP